MSFYPRRYPDLDAGELRRNYLAAEERFTRLHILDTDMLMTEIAGLALERKVRWLKVSMTSLVVAIGAFGLGAIL